MEIVKDYDATIPQINSFKLNQNSKGMTWEFKVFHKEPEELKKLVLEMADWAVENWGSREQ